MFFRVTVQFLTWVIRCVWSSLLTSLPVFGIVGIFYFSYCDRYAVMVLICIPGWCWASSHVLFDHLLVLLVECLFMSDAHFLIGFYHSILRVLYIYIWEFFTTSTYESFIQHMICKYFFQVLKMKTIFKSLRFWWTHFDMSLSLKVYTL